MVRAAQLRRLAHDDTTDAVLQAARRRLAEHGADSLSLRAIARDVGLGVSSLYQYFASRDDLVTALLVQTFHAQADAVQAAIDAAAQTSGDPTKNAGRTARVVRHAFAAYRTWSREHPHEFGLAYGTPLPGYTAPGEATISPATRIGDRLVRLLASAAADGEVDAEVVAAREEQLTDSERDSLAALVARRDYDVSLGLISLAADAMIAVHGFVAMEVFGQLRPLYPDPSPAFDRVVDDAITHVGLVRGVECPRHRVGRVSGDRMIWVDCEMTGLDLRSDALVEIAVLVTDSELTVLGEGVDLVIVPPKQALADMSERVATMHAESGLLDRLAGGVSLPDATDQVLAYVRAHVPDLKRTPLAGNSVHVDRAFLARDMPAFENAVHYRNVDVSTIKELARRWYPRSYYASPAKTGNHRALGDILDSIRELQYYRRTIFVPEPGPDTEVARAVAAAVGSSTAQT